MHRESINAYKNLVVNQKEIVHYVDIHVGGRIILK
jgi:hypothetical protein